MAINVLVFELKKCEKHFFDNNNFADLNITFFQENLNEKFLKTLPQELLENVNVISVINESSITKEIIDKFKNLRVISIRTEEYDHICVNTCEEKNIAVVNIPNEGIKSSAQFIIGVIINLVRNIIPANKIVDFKKYSEYDFMGRELSKLTLGIIGTGFVGAELCKLAKNFDITTIAYDKTIKQELTEKYNLKYVSIDELCAQADIITVSLEYIPEYYHFCNEDFFSKCKDGFYFVSTSKSEIIDYKALDKYIASGKLGGVGIDASPCKYMCEGCDNLSEKISPADLECLTQTDYINKFKEYGNVIITPHISHLTQESVNLTLEKTITNIKDAIKGERMYRII